MRLRHGYHFVAESDLSHYLEFEDHGRPEGVILANKIEFDLGEEETEDVRAERAIDGKKFTLRAHCCLGKLYIAELPKDVNCEDWVDTTVYS